MRDISDIPILLFGSGRSGTTWILDAIAETNNLRTVFEPLLPEGVPEARPFANLYVRDHEHIPRLEAFMNNVISGNLRDIWVKYRERPDRLKLSIDNLTSLRSTYHQLVRYKEFLKRYKKYRKVTSRRIIIKFIRANLMIGWLTLHYHTRNALIIRHPAAVVSSKLRVKEKYRQLDWNYHDTLNKYRADEKLFQDYLYRYDHVFQQDLNPVAAYTVIWCIENVLPIIKAQELGICVVFYEDLLVNPEEAWARILQELHLTRVPSSYLLEQPSQQTYGMARNRPFGRTQLTKWVAMLDKDNLRDIDKILTCFNVNIYSVKKPMPISRFQAEM